MKRTTVTLPEALAERVEREARRRGTSVSGLVRDALEKEFHLEGPGPRRIPWAALFHDPGMPPAAERDAHRDTWADDVDRDR